MSRVVVRGLSVIVGVTVALYFIRGEVSFLTPVGALLGFLISEFALGYLWKRSGAE